MPLIQIYQLPGLGADQKREAIEAVTAAYVAATGKDPSSVWVTLTDIAADSWGIGGEPLG